MKVRGGIWAKAVYSYEQENENEIEVVINPDVMSTLPRLGIDQSKPINQQFSPRIDFHDSWWEIWFLIVTTCMCLGQLLQLYPGSVAGKPTQGFMYQAMVLVTYVDNIICS